ncbi:hypothetical protein [Rudaea sp.]|uniref:hypothetical protein n=1 Tax=Rudaea sp. TaxID=2136325 RepID=UPI0039E6C22A
MSAGFYRDGGGHTQPADDGSSAGCVQALGLASLDPDNTLYPQLPAGRVVIELAPVFAPKTSVWVAADVPEKERAHREILRTDTPTFVALVESWRN